MAGLGNFVAGGYTATYGGAALGQTAQGYTISHEFFKRLITGDAGGDSPLNAIYRGRAQFVEYELFEALVAGIAALIEPYATVPGTPLTMGAIGQMDVSTATCGGAADVLVLTALPGTCAADAGPATITFTYSILAEGYPVRALLGPDLRSIPIRQRIYPDSTGVFGTET